MLSGEILNLCNLFLLSCTFVSVMQRYGAPGLCMYEILANQDKFCCMTGN